MGATWLLSLPDVLAEAGLEVAEYPGWETRARSSGGYDQVLAVQVHHTASATTPANDHAYMWKNAPVKPIGALHLARTGVWTVGAAGATNTSGKGSAITCSKGVIPTDGANRYVISVEAANDGVGERWPTVQIDSYIKGVRAMCDEYGLTYAYGDIHAHWEYTSRKIDPAGPSPYAILPSNSWNMDRFRSDVVGIHLPEPPDPLPGPTPPTTGDDLMYTFLDLVEVDAVLGGYKDANGIIAIVEWLSPSRYEAMAALGVPTMETPIAWLTNSTLFGEIPDGLDESNFARVIT